MFHRVEVACNDHQTQVLVGHGVLIRSPCVNRTLLMLTYALGRETSLLSIVACERRKSSNSRCFMWWGTCPSLNSPTDSPEEAFKLSRMVIAITQSDPFRLQRGKGRGQ